jgi:hypothetical protein
VVFGRYVVDFACSEPKLVIEVDGGQHADQARQDARRTEYLEALGYPSPYPLPEGEGRKAGGSPRGTIKETEAFPWREAKKTIG